MKLKTVIKSRIHNIKVTIEYDGTRSELCAYEQRLQCSDVTTNICKSLLSDAVHFTGAVRFTDIQCSK